MAGLFLVTIYCINIQYIFLQGHLGECSKLGADGRSSGSECIDIAEPLPEKLGHTRSVDYVCPQFGSLSIKVPGADLSYGVFDSAQLQGADLSRTNLHAIWLRQANLSGARMTDVQFGEWPYLQEKSEVKCCKYSPDGKTFAMGLLDGTISVYATSNWEKLFTSADSNQTVRLWDTTSGQCQAIIHDFNGIVISLVWHTTFEGDYLVTGCTDHSVRLWQLHQIGNQIQVNLCWSSSHDRSTLTDADIQDAQGLSRINQRLLQQRGTVGKPAEHTQPLLHLA